jgi:hypothetical protein
VDQNTKDLLSILIPVVGAVVTTLITAIVDLVKTRRKDPRPPAQDAQVTAQDAQAFYNSPIVLAALISTVIGISAFLIMRFLIWPTTPTRTPQPAPEIVVTRLEISFTSPDTLPGDDIQISVPPRPLIIVITKYVWNFDRDAWVFVCKRAGLCTITKLTLSPNGKWHNFLDIGSPDAEDDCAVFEVGFAVVEGETSRDFLDQFRKPETIRRPHLPEAKFLDHTWLEVKRDLDENHKEISCE